MITITIDKKEVQISAGLTDGKGLYAVADCGDRQVYLCRDGGIDIPVLPDDFIIIRGGEKFVTDKPGAIEDNPSLRTPVCPEFNGKKDLSFPKTKILGKELKSKDDKFPDGRLFVDLPDAVDAEVKDDMRLIIQDADSYFVIPSADDGDDDDNEYIDVEKCVQHERRLPRGRKYRIRIDKQKFKIAEMLISGAAILKLANKADGEWLLNQKFKGGKREPIASGDSVDLSASGVERFETVKKQAQQGDER